MAARPSPSRPRPGRPSRASGRSGARLRSGRRLPSPSARRRSHSLSPSRKAATTTAGPSARAKRLSPTASPGASPSGFTSRKVTNSRARATSSTADSSVAWKPGGADERELCAALGRLASAGQHQFRLVGAPHRHFADARGRQVDHVAVEPELRVGVHRQPAFGEPGLRLARAADIGALRQVALACGPGGGRPPARPSGCRSPPARGRGGRCCPASRGPRRRGAHAWRGRRCGVRAGAPRSGRRAVRARARAGRDSRRARQRPRCRPSAPAPASRRACRSRCASRPRAGRRGPRRRACRRRRASRAGLPGESTSAVPIERTAAAPRMARVRCFIRTNSAIRRARRRRGHAGGRAAPPGRSRTGPGATAPGRC